jgi:hypothetical protein
MVSLSYDKEENEKKITIELGLEKTDANLLKRKRPCSSG